MNGLRVTVLLAEDDPLSADMLSRRLSRCGYEVTVVGNGLDALYRARANRPDLILMDVSLPEMDGLEVTRRLRADPATAGIPVIALTAHAMTRDREAALAAGCDEFETKPIGLKALLDKMENLAPQGAPS